MEKRDFIVDSIRKVDMSDLKMPIVVVYDHPDDYQSYFVARVFDADKPTNVVIFSEDLKELMDDLSDSGMVFVPPMANEPQCIIGSFI